MKVRARLSLGSLHGELGGVKTGVKRKGEVLILKKGNRKSIPQSMHWGTRGFFRCIILLAVTGQKMRIKVSIHVLTCPAVSIFTAQKG
jgi:hypothetical protein